MVLSRSFQPHRDESFEELIERGLKGSEFKKSRNGRLHASDVLCERKAVYDSNWEGEEIETPDKYHFIKGGMVSEEINKYSLKETASLLFDEYKMPDIGINLGGRVDAIVHYKNKLWVVEMKQIGSLPTSPKKYHESQTMLYSAITGLPAILYYVDRKVITPFPQTPSHRAFFLDSGYDNRFKYLSRAVKSNLYNESKLIPDKPIYLKKSWCPSHCKLKEVCWGGESFPSNDGLEGFMRATVKQIKEIEVNGDKITKQLLNREVLKDRFNGVLSFLEKNSRHKITKQLLSGQEWDDYFYY